MEVYINEQSLHSQYHSNNDFKNALLIVIASLNSLEEIKPVILRNELLYLMPPIRNTNLGALLKANSDLSYRFKDAIQKNNVKSWEGNRVQVDSVVYKYVEEICNESSMAELAEKKYNDSDFKGFLLNFQNSKFGDSSEILISRDKEDVILNCAYDVNSINQYLISNNLIDENNDYDEALKIAPTDLQTVLKDSSIFERTNYPKNNGRTVYRRIGTNQLWTVDGATKHATVKAHIEVFDENTRKHLGTSLYNIIHVDVSYLDPKRKITLE